MDMNGSGNGQGVLLLGFQHGDADGRRAVQGRNQFIFREPIIDPGDPVWMYAQVYEYELPFVKVGQTVDMDVPALAGERFTGKVKAIDALVDQATRTTRIRAQIEDPQGHLRPDTYVNATIIVDLGEQLAVPSEAVFNTGAQQIVFVDKGEGVLEPRAVTLGAKADAFYQVKAGLAEGELVVVSGNFLIDSESRLKAAMEAPAATDTPSVSSGGPAHVH